MLKFSDPVLQQYVRAPLGDPEKDAGVYDATSPIKYIRNVRAPLLVLQGDNDPRVPKEKHSKSSTSSSKTARPSKFITIPMRATALPNARTKLIRSRDPSSGSIVI